LVLVIVVLIVVVPDEEEHPDRKILVILLRGRSLPVVELLPFLLFDEEPVCYDELDAFIPDKNVCGKPGLFPVGVLGC
jgi:hypothetical protein